MQIKTFEIRDRGTFIPALAIKLTNDENNNLQDLFLLTSAGLNRKGSYSLALFDLNGGRGFMDSNDWGFARTFKIAHDYIEVNFDALESGQVIDVEYILGETKEPKKSESLLHSGIFGEQV